MNTLLLLDVASSPLPDRTEGHCSWNWQHVGNICWKSLSSAGYAGGADDVTEFCARHGAHVFVVGSTYLCVKDAKASSSPRRTHRGLMEIITPLQRDLWAMLDSEGR
ncbi:uncharacterized protein LOC112563906 [Pomacea canaliculata]|uniref:uncharacterized protein LOC112563906 n=1 Tax=Pomacea canaliculata TaxID=400727 RepID=UPI000D737D33|nr:uncharacterized protein LOC112563906 [Pomacea canaliculata]